ncbi:PucR family transcriptional regulator [Crassaminicella thermophila]|nr:PucR family transcriptional regulator [Crassaminicella thermophila]
MLKESGITVKQAIEMDCLKKSKIVAGHRGIHNIISKVNIMADPDIFDWVSEGELLLTTAYSFKKDDIAMQKKFIIEASKKKLAGIGIKIYPYMDGLAKEVIDIADYLGLPIIDIDYATPFTDIMTPIFKEIFNKQAALLQKVERVHNHLMDVMLREGGIKEIIKTLKKIIQNPIVVRDHYFDTYIYHMEENETYDYDTLIEKSNKFFDRNNDYKWMNIKTERIEVLKDKEVKRIMIPIIVKGNVYGHIFVWEMSKEISNYDQVALESASTIMALEFLKKSSVYAVEHRYKAEFFEDLISNDEKRKERAMSRANIYKLDCNAYYAVFNIFIEDAEKDMEFKNKLVLNLEKLCVDQKMNTLIIGKEKKIYIITMWRSEKNIKNKLNIFGSKIDEFMKINVKDEKYKIGIGRIYKGLGQIHRSIKDAEKAIEIGNIFSKEKVVNFEDLGIYKIFCQERLNEELDKFYQETLLPLVEYDKNKNTEFVKTLQGYFETNGNIKKTSELLFTHYNTVLYRMQRIKEITGRDIEDPEDRYNLETALKIMKILRYL